MVQLKVNKDWGFSLYEMTIIVVILSILVTSIYLLIPVTSDQQNIDITKTKLDRIQTAIDTYVNQNGYIPCPADKTAALATPTFGRTTNCTTATATGTTEFAGGTANENLRIGAVPTRDLNLPDSFMFDAWNNRFTYAVVKSLAVTANGFNTTSVANTAIIIHDSSNNPINSTTVAYTIVSHGKHGDGATNYTGTTSTCPTGVPEAENCNNDNIFLDAFFNGGSSNFFDDIIRWKTRTQEQRDGSYYINGAGATPIFSKYALVADLKAAGVDGGDAAAGWNTRSLSSPPIFSSLSTTISVNSVTGVITLGPGNYYIKATAPGYRLGPNKLRLWNNTAGSLIVEGMTVSGDITASNSTTVATVAAYVGFSTSTDIRVDHYSTVATTTGMGFGIGAVGVSNNTYTMVEIFGQ